MLGRSWGTGWGGHGDMTGGYVVRTLRGSGLGITIKKDAMKKGERLIIYHHVGDIVFHLLGAVWLPRQAFHSASMIFLLLAG
jgi:hypothetical protein